MVKEGTPPLRKVRAFIQQLSNAGGFVYVDGSPADPMWIRAACEDYTPVDTYNRAHELGWTRTLHDSDTGISRLAITESGRRALEGKQV